MTSPPKSAASTSPDPRPAKRLPTSWADLDRLLGGGWPVGRLCELRGSGGTSLALGALREARRAGQPVAWIDGTGTFCPATADLWPTETGTGTGAGTGTGSGMTDPDGVTLVRARPPQHRPRGSPDGSQGGPRGGPRRPGRSPAGPALFAADVLLRSRAYGLLVLDVPPRVRAPTSAWFRLARLAKRAHCPLLLLYADPSARRALSGSAADLLLDVRMRPAPDDPPFELPGHGHLGHGRLGHEPQASPEHWSELAPSELEVRLVRLRCPTHGASPRARVLLPVLPPAAR